MAKGITETDVHTAADTLVAAGERPTVERIRAHLGTGSPNTVTRWLETWWGGLGERLIAQRAKLALPDAPAAVAELATQWWEQALATAQERTAEAFAGERLALADAQAALKEREANWQRQLGDYARLSDEAGRLLQAAEERLADAQRLSQQQAAQIEDLTAQRNELKQRAAVLDRELDTLRQQLAQTSAAAAAEREHLRQHVQGIEDHAYTEVDRARQETKVLRKELQAQIRSLQTELQASQKGEEKTRLALARSQQVASAQRARAETLAKLKPAPRGARGTTKTASTARRRKTTATS